MKNINLIKNIAFLCFIIIGTGCKKLIEVPSSLPGQIENSQVFADSLSAVNSVVGMYTTDFGKFGVLSGQMTLYPGMSSDELLSSYGGSDLQYVNNALIAGSTGSTSSSSGLWNGSYGSTYIYQANSCIEGIASSTKLSASLKNQLIGECEVIRSLLYFNLTNIFGAVPLAKTSNYLDNNKLARAPQDSIYAFIINNLTDAVNRLPVKYATSGRARPNKYTALALLSKVYLYTKQYAKAEAEASLIINSGTYGLVTDLNGVFLDGSNEAIWQAPGVGYSTTATAEGNYILPYEFDIIPPYYLTPALTNAFEAGDQRKINWADTLTVDGTLYYYPNKYKNSYYTNPENTVEDYMIFRLGEQYLIRAEARVQQGNLSGGIQDLNMIRQRAGLPNTKFTSQSDLITAILHERQTELFCEWGNRWFDLKRSGSINAVLGAEKPGIWPADGHAALYPIPYDQIKLDVNLKQNPGY